MAEKGRDQELTAFQQVYSALKDLDVETRGRVISSVLAMLGTSQTTFPNPARQMSQPAQTQPVEPSAFPSSGRPLSLIELMQQKNPGTNGQKIALFAYYREKYEGLSRFSRDDLKSYFATAKQQPSANYDRDFVEAVRKGWIHENGADSYLTSKGVEELLRAPSPVSAGTRSRRERLRKGGLGRRPRGGEVLGKSRSRANDTENNRDAGPSRLTWLTSKSSSPPNVFVTTWEIF